MRITGPIPENILRRMAPQDRPSGKAGLTYGELMAASDAKLEADLHEQCASICRHRGIVLGHARMDKASTFTEGWPDLTLVVGGRAILVELKVGRRKLSPAQERIKALLEAPPNCAVVHVVRTLEEFMQVLNGGEL